MLAIFVTGATLSLLFTTFALAYLLVGIIACHRKGGYPPSWLLYVFLTVCLCAVAMFWAAWPDLAKAAIADVKGLLK